MTDKEARAVRAWLTIENVNGISVQDRAAVCRWLRNHLIHFETVSDVHYTQNEYVAVAEVKNGAFQ